MDVGILDILGGIIQNRVIDPQWLEVEVVMEVCYSGGRGGRGNGGHQNGRGDG